jgi:hypothetical protein
VIVREPIRHVDRFRDPVGKAWRGALVSIRAFPFGEDDPIEFILEDVNFPAIRDAMSQLSKTVWTASELS